MKVLSCASSASSTSSFGDELAVLRDSFLFAFDLKERFEEPAKASQDPRSGLDLLRVAGAEEGNRHHERTKSTEDLCQQHLMRAFDRANHLHDEMLAAQFMCSSVTHFLLCLKHAASRRIHPHI